jgi:hypothetical protein
MTQPTIVSGFFLFFLIHLIASITVSAYHINLWFSSSRLATFQVDLTIERIDFSNKTATAVLDFKDLALKRFNRTHKTISGQLTFLKDINDDYEVSPNNRNH